MNKVQILGHLFPFRTFSSQDKFTLIKQSKMLNKVMGVKKRHYDFGKQDDFSHILKSVTSHSYKKTTGSSRRSSMFSNVLMRHITDLLASGEASVDIAGKGVQITGVRLSRDFQGINVYWMTTIPENMDEIEKSLPEVSVKLRHDLSQLRLVGHVPKIVFVKDDSTAKQMQVESLLAKADFGEDYVPQHPISKASSIFSSDEKVLAESSVDAEGNKVLPPMRHDIFGLRHDFIMSKVQAFVKKSYALHRVESIKSDSDVISENEGNSDSKITVDNERQKNFSKFIIAKHISEKKKREQKRKQQADLEAEVYEQNVRDSGYNDTDFDDIIDIRDDDEDFLHELEEMYKAE